MTDKSDVAGRLRARADEQERNNSYPVDRALDREAADEIDRLTAAIASERERAEKAERERAEADKKYRETLSLLNDSMAICWGTGMDAIALARKVTELEGALIDIGIYGCGMLNQPAAMNGPEEAWLKKRIAEYERRARSVLKETKDG